MRISELLNLKIGSIKRDFGDYIFEFEQNGGANHKVILNELALSYLGKIFARMIKNEAEKAGLSSQIHPHTAHVSFIKQSHKEGMDIYSIRNKVGHSSVKITERYLE